MSKILEGIQKYWDARSGGFSDASLEELETEPGMRWKRIFGETLDKGNKVLDDGAGAGFFTVLLSSMGYNVTAVDYSAGMIERIKRNLQEKNLTANVFQMDVQALEFKEETFDALVSRNVFWNLEKPEKAYEEAARVLKPGGKLILEDGNFYLRFYHPKYQEAYENMQNEEEYAQSCHARHNKENVDFTIMENIAKELPLSRIERPVWDFRKLTELGFRDIHVKIQGDVLLTSFLIIAVKGV